MAIQFDSESALDEWKSLESYEEKTRFERIFEFLCSAKALLWTIPLFIWASLSVASTVIGVIYIDGQNCLASTNLASLLTFSGGLMLLISLIFGGICVLGWRSSLLVYSSLCTIVLFLILNFGIQTYLLLLVFSVNLKATFGETVEVGGSFSNKLLTCCNPTLFYFAFCYATLGLSLFILMTLILCSWCCLAVFFKP